MSGLLALLVLLPPVAGGLLLVSRAERLAPAVALGTAGLAVPLGVAAAVARPTLTAPFLAGLPLTLRVDGLAALLLVVVPAVTVAVLTAGLAEVRTSRARWAGLVLVFLGAVLLTVTAADLLALLLGWEVMGACSFALIAFAWREPGAAGSGTTAFLTTRAADLGLYAAAGAALTGGGSLALDGLPGLSGWPLHLAALGVVAAALGKAAQLPFSFWLARAMAGPASVSALLHSAAMVAMGGYLLLRVAPLLAAAGWAAPVVAWCGAATAVLLGLVALAQRDLKLLLAASTASQLGLVVLAAGVGSVAGGALHLAAHAFVKSALFLAAGAWLVGLGTRDLAALQGAGRRHARLGALFGAGALSLAGLPPFALWVTKDEVLAAARVESPALWAAGLLASALAAGYAARAAALVLRPLPGGTPLRVPALAWAPLVPLTAVGVLGGALLLPPVRAAAERLLGPAPAPGAAELLLSGVLAAAAAAVAWRTATPQPRGAPAALRDWLHLERLVHAGVVRPVLALSRALAVLDDRVLAPAPLRAATGARTLAAGLRGVDDRVLEPVVTGAARGAERLADGFRRVDEGGLDPLVTRSAAAVRALGDLARRPQTGQVHQYLAQSAAVLVAALVLLLLRG